MIIKNNNLRNFSNVTFKTSNKFYNCSSAFFNEANCLWDLLIIFGTALLVALLMLSAACYAAYYDTSDYMKVYFKQYLINLIKKKKTDNEIEML